MPLGFDDVGRPVPVEHPAVYDVEIEGDERDQARDELLEKLCSFVDWIAGDGNVKKAGRRAVLAQHLAGRGGCRTDSELASRLNITPGRLSQLRAEMEAVWPGFGRCNRRQI
jgi:hypothetical protein